MFGAEDEVPLRLFQVGGEEVFVSEIVEESVEFLAGCRAEGGKGCVVVDGCC